MKTIELMISGQKAQFTTKSVTIDGKEYLYSHMTSLDHSPVVHTYKFEYEDGDTKLLTYEKKDAKIMAAIFNQVHKMLEMKKAKAVEKTAEAPSEMDELVKATIALNEERAKKEAEKADKKARKKAKKNGTPLPEEEKKEGNDESVSEEPLPVDPEKQARLKKSLRIFGIILGVLIAVSVIYYFVFGTSNAPSETNPNTTESQQYEDIDQLIDDLQ